MIMALLLYADLKKEAGRRIKRTVERLLRSDDLMVSQTLFHLSETIRKPAHHIHIAILLALQEKDMEEILSMRDYFHDIRTILILPNRDRKTITMAHSLYPRFVSYVDSDFQEVALVLEKMLRRKPAMIPAYRQMEIREATH
jgi:hypothetical protein